MLVEWASGIWADLPHRRALATVGTGLLASAAAALWIDTTLPEGSEQARLIELSAGVGAAAATALLALALFRLARLEHHPLTHALTGGVTALSLAALAHVVADGGRANTQLAGHGAVARLLATTQWTALALILLSTVALTLRPRRLLVPLVWVLAAGAGLARLDVPAGSDAAHTFLPASPVGAGVGLLLFGGAAAIIRHRLSREGALGSDGPEPVAALGLTLCAALASVSGAGLVASILTGQQDLGHTAALLQLVVATLTLVAAAEHLTTVLLRGHRAEADEATVLASGLAEEHAALSRRYQELRHDGHAALTAMQSVVEAVKEAADRGDTAGTADLIAVLDDELYRLRRLLRPNAYAGRDYAVADVLERMELMYRSRGLDIRALADRTVRVNGDPDVLARVLANLIQNVLDHAPNARARLLGYQGRTGVIIEVIDDGPGIDPRMRKVVLERGVSTKMLDGSGLGLAAAAEQLEPIGGTLQLGEGEHGRGLRVIVTLGASRPATAVDEPTAVAQPTIDLTGANLLTFPVAEAR